MMKKALNIVQNFVNQLVQSDEQSTTTVEIYSGPCFLLELPPELHQFITEHLSLRDLHCLSRTCRTFYNLINDDSFWTHRIRCQYPRAIAQLYTFDLFEKPELIETEDPERPAGFFHNRYEAEIDRLAIHSATHYNDEALANRHAKMYVSKDNFIEQVQFFQYTKPEKKLLSTIPTMKLVYFYLIDRKRRAMVDMNVTHRNNYYLVEQTDPDSLTGRIIHLNNVCWLEITGDMKHQLMPGKYEVRWRMKFSSAHIQISGRTEFIVVPSHGKLIIHTMQEEDFRALSIEYRNQWFERKMGQIEIYEPSTVLLAIRNWHDGNWKSNLSWDCIELVVIP